MLNYRVGMRVAKSRFTTPPRDRLITLTGDRDHVTAELLGIRGWHDADPSSEDLVLTGKESTQPWADPLVCASAHSPTPRSCRRWAASVERRGSWAVALPGRAIAIGDLGP